jgi:hypothetical protein
MPLQRIKWREKMERKNIYLLIFLIIGVLLIASCKPINIFSPLVNPSKMGNDAKLDAGYNAISSGDYDEAIDYFSDVIDSSSGDQLVDAYLGRGTAYMYKASSNINSVTEDLLDGDLQADDQGAIISQVVENGDYITFFTNIDNAADDYNAAIDNTTGGYDSGVLFEAYQTNMMAATGIGSQKIAADYSTAPWRVPTDVTMNAALDAIVNDDPTHDGRMETWEVPPGVNGLRDYVFGNTEATLMMSYLTNAFNALEEMKDNPPTGMSQQDILDIQTGIKEWAVYGLDDLSLGTP